MLRITVVESSGLGVVLHVEGQLVGRGVEELQRSCEGRLSGAGIPFTIDLADVSFADAAAIELLKAMRNQNVAVVNASPYLALQIECNQGKGFK